jgi:hypothetical protein
VACEETDRFILSLANMDKVARYTCLFFRSSVADPGCFIPDPDPEIFHPGSGSRIGTGTGTLWIPDPGGEKSTDPGS